MKISLGFFLLWFSSARALRGDAEEGSLKDSRQAFIEAKKLPPTSEQRELGIRSKMCDALIAKLFPGSATPDCSCDTKIKPPFAVTVGCEAAEKVCIIPPEVLCGFPQFEFAVSAGSLKEGKLPVMASVCYSNPTIVNINIPEIIPFCIDLGNGPILKLLGRGVSGESVPDPGSAVIVEETCTARFGETECNSCTVCDAVSGSVVFNCTNIAPELVSTSCAPLPSF